MPYWWEDVKDAAWVPFEWIGRATRGPIVEDESYYDPQTGEMIAPSGRVYSRDWAKNVVAEVKAGARGAVEGAKAAVEEVVPGAGSKVVGGAVLAGIVIVALAFGAGILFRR